MSKLVWLLLFIFTVTPLSAQTTTDASVIDVGPNCDLHGYLPGDSTSPWNQVVTNYPVDSHNAAFHSDWSSFHLHIDFAGTLYGPHGINYNCVDQTVTPFVPVNMVQYLSDSDTTLYPFYPSMAIEDNFPACPYDPRPPQYRPAGTPPNANPNDYDDHHGLAITRDGWNYEVWTAFYCGGQFGASNGSVWDMNKNEHRPYGMTSADAAGLPMFPYLIKYDETATPRCLTPLNGSMVQTFCHASRITWSRICGAGYHTGDLIHAFVAPAMHGASNTASTDCYLFEGARMRLRADYPEAGFSGQELVMIHTWKTYGFSLNDLGSVAFVSGTGDPRWDTQALLALQAISASDVYLLSMGTQIYTDIGRPPQGSAPTGLQPVPTGSAPTITAAPTPSTTTIVQGQSAQLTPSAVNGADYTFITGALPIRDTTKPVNVSPQTTTTFCQTARNAFDSAAACAPPLTVLIPSFKGFNPVGLR